MDLNTKRKTKIFIAVLLALIIPASIVFFPSASLSFRLYDLADKSETSLEEAVDDLKRKRIVLVGEIHSRKEHHQAQLAVIKKLSEAGAKVAVGLEMFSRESRKELDHWISGKLDSKAFQKIYYQNWNLPWQLYSMIFEYCRNEKIPMTGLNVPREITQKVAHRGFDSLTETEKGKLSDVACIVSPEYKKYIMEVFGAHAHGNLDFTYFCEAQLVWDTVMAIHALEYLKAKPDTILVILTGNGHARKMGIPAQIEKRSDMPYAVILPRVPGYISTDTVTVKEADYIVSGFNTES